MGIELDLLAVGNGKKSGDAILLRYGDLHAGGIAQKVVLIDGGYKNTAEEIKRMLEKYYKCKNSSGKYVIDLVILSHPDSDHVCGLVELSRDPTIEIKKIIMQKPWDTVDKEMFKEDGRRTDVSLSRKLKEAFSKAYELSENTKDIPYIDGFPCNIKIGEGIFHFLAPSEALYKELIAASNKTPDSKSGQQEPGFSPSEEKGEETFHEGDEIAWDYEEVTSNINETSMVILFEYSTHKILFTGDAGKRCLREAIKYIMDNKINIEGIDIIKMPHHGSRKNVTPEIMDFFKGENTRCYIACAQGDEGHHPSKRLVNMLNQKGFKVHRTSGNNIRWNSKAPNREGYRPARPMDNYPRMEK